MMEAVAEFACNRSLTVAALKRAVDSQQLTEPRASASGLSASFAITSMGKEEGAGPEGKKPAARRTTPTCIAFNLASSVRDQAQRVCLGGFGVGLTWGGILMNLGPMLACEVVEYRLQDH
jgi:hypothetical protein